MATQSAMTEGLHHSTQISLSIHTTTTRTPTDMSFFKNTHVAQLYKTSERFTRPHARRLIQQVGLLQMDETPSIVLDSACGTGVVSSLLYEMLNENAKETLQLVCGDFSEAMVQSVQQRIVESEWKGAKAQVVDARV
jgi:ubiquinone/menaquinone biosynthesis C-methylase UbiE